MKLDEIKIFILSLLFKDIYTEALSPRHGSVRRSI
jgi:hypothetical protein